MNKAVYALVMAMMFTLVTLPAVNAAATYSIFAGQTIYVGQVAVSNDSTNIMVQVTVNSPWIITELHIHAADSLAEIPQTTKGNPKIGHFMLKYEGLSTQDMGPIQIPLGDWTQGDTVFMAVHAVVESCTEEETAWGGCPELSFPGSSWAFYLEYTVT